MKCAKQNSSSQNPFLLKLEVTTTQILISSSFLFKYMLPFYEFCLGHAFIGRTILQQSQEEKESLAAAPAADSLCYPWPSLSTVFPLAQQAQKALGSLEHTGEASSSKQGTRELLAPAPGSGRQQSRGSSVQQEQGKAWQCYPGCEPGLPTCAPSFMN